MKMENFRREGLASSEPASHDVLKITFRNFHDRTMATFEACPFPDREPDFISSSRSTYWDMGDHVIRASDHWAGQNGCMGQASCFWTIDRDLPPREWASGKAFYAGFRIRRQVIRTLCAKEADIDKARLIQKRGAVPLAEWISTFGPGQIPSWARRAFRDAPGLSPEAQSVFAGAPALSHAVTADRRVLDGLLGPNAHIDLGYRLETL